MRVNVGSWRPSVVGTAAVLVVYSTAGSVRS